jgi:arylsulfatase A-like enzyme
MHEREHEARPDAEISARIEQYEMAFRMQSSVPEATDLSKEPDHVFEMYGEDSRTPGTFASNCILARRLAERNVKFIQLFHTGWDHHGSLPKLYPRQAAEVDRGAAALIQDLKQRGLLKDTLVVWGGEFGRTPYSQGIVIAKTLKDTYGRDHHRECFTFWMAGGGIKPGMTYGESDDIGFEAVRDPVTVNDFHATMLHLLGVDHERLTYRFQGRDFRLTDVAGKLVKGILA